MYVHVHMYIIHILIGGVKGNPLMFRGGRYATNSTKDNPGGHPDCTLGAPWDHPTTPWDTSGPRSPKQHKKPSPWGSVWGTNCAAQFTFQ